MSFAQGLADLSTDYWGLKQVYEAGSVTCFDPECEGVAEPERDGDHVYFSCTECGSDFGHERVPDDGSEDGACAIGVPVDIRKNFSAGMEQALAPPIGVPVTLGKRNG